MNEVIVRSTNPHQADLELHYNIMKMLVGICLELLIILVCVNSWLSSSQKPFRFQGKSCSRLRSQSESQELDPLWKRTSQCLDFGRLMDYVLAETATLPGKELLPLSFTNDALSATNEYARLEQLSAQIALIPNLPQLDVLEMLERLEKNVATLERVEFAIISLDIEDLVLLYKTVLKHKDTLTLFEQELHDLALPEELVRTFENSFDEDRNLNIDKYPILKRLRNQMASVRASIMSKLTSMVSSAEFKHKIPENLANPSQAIQIINGRYCIALRNTYKRTYGIAHGGSSSGKTVYVEPLTVVEQANELQDLEEEFRSEEEKIFAEMTRMLLKHADKLHAAIQSAARVDVLRAKITVAERYNGIIPEVLDEGCIRCGNARHPLLALRSASTSSNTASLANPNKNKIVGNPLQLNNEHSALVISGPNAGGKTIILKTCGLFALMVRFAIPLPAAQGARVDYFSQVFADIGDSQSVDGDVSTFSGHLLIIRDILQAVRDNYREKKHCLVLLDEIGTGTDPAQGAAFAQAVLEDLIANHARMIITTHYNRVKELAAQDPRFTIAAMEFIDNLPTYRLRTGSVGESYALELAQRLNLPADLLVRATALLDDESKRLITLQQRLEEETTAARKLQAEYEANIASLSEREAKIEESVAQLNAQIKKLRDRQYEEHVADLREKERELEELIVKAREYARLASQPSSVACDTVGAVMSNGKIEHQLESFRSQVKAQRVQGEQTLAQISQQALKVEGLEPGVPVEPGTRLVVLEQGSLYGSTGIVTSRNKGKGRVLIRVAGVEVKIERHLLGRPAGPDTAASKSINDSDKPLSSRDRHMMAMLEAELVDPKKMAISSRDLRKAMVLQPRTVDNTLDIREMTGFDPVKQAVQTFMESALLSASDSHASDYNNEGTTAAQVLITTTIYIQHGVSYEHKLRLREWLKNNSYVRKCQAAPVADGGEACTAVIAELKA